MHKNIYNLREVYFLKDEYYPKMKKNQPNNSDDASSKQKN